MRQYFYMASVAALAFTRSAAFAADLPIRPPPPLIPVFTWTGIYIGGQIGYIWSGGDWGYSGFDPSSQSGFASDAGTSAGLIGGAHVGYNYQINQWVFGLDGSVDGTGFPSNPEAIFPVAFGGASVTARTNANIQGSIRGRLGFALERALFYVTGGVAFGGFDSSYTFAGNSGANPLINGGGLISGQNSFSGTRAGWTLGGGIDYALDNNWSIFGEYRYTSFGTISNSGLAASAFSQATGLSGGFLTANRSLNQNQVQVGFSYKFDLGNPVPVVAKY